MNNPPYIVVDEIGAVVTATKAALGLTNLNYQYGYLPELRTTLGLYGSNPTYEAKKYPLVWLVQPFTIERSGFAQFGKVKLQVFIINGSTSTWTAAERMANNFNPVIYPIYRGLIAQLAASKAFSETLADIKHKTTDRYYWGTEQQKDFLDDVFDCMQVADLQLTLKNNNNCP